MRDDSRVKERIALTLDPRQLVSIVLGSAVLLGIVFYLGVTVGKDLGGPQIVAVGDPLERLDQQAALAGERLTFPEDLTRAEAPTEEEKAQLAAAAEMKRSETAAKEAAAARAAEAKREADAAAEAKAAAEEKSAGEAARAETAPAAGAKPAVPHDLSAALAGSGAQGRPMVPPPPPVPAPAGTPSLDVSAALAKVDARNAVKPPPVPASDKVHAGGFTVQVAASPSKREAEALVAKLREKGVNATVTAAEIAGRGTFYRVRVGRFGSREEAVRYLEDLRRETRLEGFVASLEN